MEREGVALRDGEREVVRETELVGVLDGVPVHVTSPEGVPLLVLEVELTPDGVIVGVRVGDAPVDNDLVADGVIEDVRVELRDIVCVRDDVSVAVFDLLTEGGGHVGVAPSSIRRRRLLPLSAIHNVEPAMAMPEGAKNFAAVPSLKPMPPESVLTVTKGHAFTSTMTRI